MGGNHASVWPVAAHVFSNVKHFVDEEIWLAVGLSTGIWYVRVPKKALTASSGLTYSCPFLCIGSNRMKPVGISNCQVGGGRDYGRRLYYARVLNLIDRHNGGHLPVQVALNKPLTTRIVFRCGRNLIRGGVQPCRGPWG